MARKTLPPGIDRLPSGKIRARYRDDAGRWHSSTFTGVREAQRWLREQRSDVDRGRHFDPKCPTTVAEAAEAWVESRPYKPASLIRMRRHVANHIAGTALGRMRLVEVRASDVQAWVGGRSKVLSAQTVGHVYRLVTAVFATAVDDRIIATTPCTRHIARRKVDTRRVDPLTVDQVTRLSAAMPPHYRILIHVQAGLGLRIGEALGLQVRDIDFFARHRLGPASTHPRPPLRPTQEPPPGTATYHCRRTCVTRWPRTLPSSAPTTEPDPDADTFPRA